MIRKENITGAEIILAALEAEGVDTLFGYPGGAVLPLYDALYHNKNIRHVLTRHEQGAAHAADGYARSTGRPGVVFATSGPGATNLVTGLANAMMDSVPMVAITGQVARSLLGKDSFQEANITGITIPITKYSYLVQDVKDLARVIREAFHIATSGRPGPVLIDIPKDVTTQRADFVYPPEMDLPGYRTETPLKDPEVDEALKVIASSRRPVMFVGGGVRNAGASSEVRRLAETLNIPVIYSLMGKGVMPDDHELTVGMVGMHGVATANYAMSHCDLILGIGVRFDDRVTGDLATFAPDAKIVHIDVDPAEIGKIVSCCAPVHGDARPVVARMNEKLAGGSPLPDISPWHDMVTGWKKEHPLTFTQDPAGVIKPQYVVTCLSRETEGRAYVTTEVGQNQMWAAQYFQVDSPEKFVTSGGLGTMGFGLPSAMGVALGNPGSPVVAIAGDGSFQMNVQELQTIRENNLPVVMAILNNRQLGMVKQWQELFFEERYSQTIFDGQPDFVKLADAYGIPGRRVLDPSQVIPAIGEALASGGPYLLDFVVDATENVFPMVPAGGSLDNMLK